MEAHCPKKGQRFRVCMKSGIYLITNTVSSKEYVGKAKDLQKRRHDHFSLLRRGKHRNPHLQNAYNLYGEGLFKFEILEYCEEKDLVKEESRWTVLLNTMDPNGYNICKIGCSPMEGRHHTQKTKDKISVAKKANPTRHWKGKTFSTETREKQSFAKLGNKNALGNKHTEETREKLSIKSRAYWESRRERV